MKLNKLAKLFFLSFGILYVISCEDELSIDNIQNSNNHKQIMIWKNGINHLKLNHPNAKEEISKNSIKLEVIVVGCIHQRIK